MCSVVGCETAVHSLGFCQKHYRLFKKYGKPEVLAKEERKPPGPKPEPEKWRSRHNPDNPTRDKIHKSDRKQGTETHCGRGHEFTEANTFMFQSSDREGLRRGCRKCRQNQVRKNGGKLLKPNAEVVGVDNKNKSNCAKGHEFSDENTYLDPKTGDRHCRSCRTLDAKIWRLKTIYGLTLNQSEKMFAAQEGKCWICLREFSETLTPCVDHDHATGEIRGLLCNGCNSGLGQFRDSVDVILRAIEYLQKTHTLP